MDLSKNCNPDFTNMLELSRVNNIKPAGWRAVDQDEEDDSGMFIRQCGVCKVVLDGERVADRNPAACFGEVMLLWLSTKRTAIEGLASF